LDTKNTIEQHYELLLNKHEESFKTITKTTTDVSLLTISASIEDFKAVNKALPQTTEIAPPADRNVLWPLDWPLQPPSTPTISQSSIQKFWC
jgi:hypothetical protein